MRPLVALLQGGFYTDAIEYMLWSCIRGPDWSRIISSSVTFLQMVRNARARTVQDHDADCRLARVKT